MANLLKRDADGAAPNPFTPGFGKTPQVLVGRSRLLAGIKDGLNAGPADPRFSTILLGNRGAGKTVVLNDLEDTAAEAGWTVLPVDASTPGLMKRIGAQLEAAKTSDALVASAGLNPPAVQKKWAAGIDVRVARVSRELVQDIEHDWDFRRQIETLGRHAAEAGTAVLLSVDEIHAAERSELRRFSADMQHAAQRASLPVAFVGAGLADMRHTILQDRKMTFFHRCEQEWVPPIETAEAHRFYADVLAEAGARCDSGAIERMAFLTDGLPYKMQLLGHHAWLISGAPEHVIGHDHIDAAAEHTERAMTARVYLPTWRDLGETERTIMETVGRAGGAVSRHRMTQLTGLAPGVLSDSAERLEQAGCLDLADPARLALGPMMSLAVLEDATRRTDSFASAAAAQAATADSGAGQRPRCGRRMKRTSGRCILPAGHSGRCRSR